MNFELKTERQIEESYTDLENFKIERQAIIETYQVVLGSFETVWQDITEKHLSIFIFDKNGNSNSTLLLENSIDHLEFFEYEEIEGLFDALVKNKDVEKYSNIFKSRDEF